MAKEGGWEEDEEEKEEEATENTSRLQRRVFMF